MNLWREFSLRVLVVGSMVAGLRLAGTAVGQAGAGELPKDACALLKPAEIQAALSPDASVGSGVPDNSAAPLAVACTYTWGPDSREWGKFSVTSTVIDAAQGWPGVSADLLAQGVLLKVKTGGPDASPIPGVGDAAVFTFEARVSTASAEAFFKTKGVHFAVTFHGEGALSSKEKVIALLKQAAGRL